MVLAVLVGPVYLGLTRWSHESGMAAPRPGDVSGVVIIHSAPPAFGLQREVTRMSHAQVLVSGRTTAGKTVHRRLRTDAVGRFNLRLMPGRYRFTIPVFKRPLPPGLSEPHRVVTVEPGHTVGTRVVVMFNHG